MDIEYLKKRGEEFLKTSEYHLNNEMYDLGAFDLEQALQLFLKYTIFLKLKSYPPTHSLKSLFKILSEVYNKSKEVNEILKNKYQLISNLEQSYISSRYLPYSYTKEEVIEFKDFVNEVVEFLRNLWQKI
ncbi:MAG: HEPN domain-containing protein [Caldisericia bacterium]